MRDFDPSWCDEPGLGRHDTPVPRADETDGWGFIGETIFAGPGWSGVYGQQPLNDFDLASKIHDAHYVCNNLKFSRTGTVLREVVVEGKIIGQSEVGSGRAYRLDSEQRLRSLAYFGYGGIHDSITKNCRDGCPRHKYLSRVVKADAIFQLMNDLHPPGVASTTILNFLADLTFDGDARLFLRADDGFRCFLTDPEIRRCFENPAYNMIPRSAAASTFGHGSQAGQRTSFYEWFERRYARIMPEIRRLTSTRADVTV